MWPLVKPVEAHTHALPFIATALKPPQTTKEQANNFNGTTTTDTNATGKKYTKEYPTP